MRDLDNITKVEYHVTPDISDNDTYDELNRRMMHTDRLGQISRFQYDGTGNFVSTYPASGEERHTD